jgi:hypothetical protein
MTSSQTLQNCCPDPVRYREIVFQGYAWLPTADLRRLYTAYSPVSIDRFSPTFWPVFILPPALLIDTLPPLGLS